MSDGGRNRRNRVLAVLAWSAIVWTTLWSDVSVANLLWGVVVGAVTLWLDPVPDSAFRLQVRPFAFVRLVMFAGWALVRSSAVVAWEVMTPTIHINHAIVAAPLRTGSPALTTLIANIISLTPGTLTLEVVGDPPTLYVHIMHFRSIEEVRGEIAHLEDLAMRAFPSTEPGTRPEEEPWTS